MTANNTMQNKSKGPDLKALGLKSPLEVIDILAALKVDGVPVITDERAHLDPKLRAEIVINYFKDRFNVTPSTLPYIASIIKRNLKSGKLKWET